MKTNSDENLVRAKWRAWLWQIPLLGAFVLTLIICIVSIKMNFSGYDIGLRYHEVCCSHDGINPFHIWNHDVTSDKYKGADRADMITESAPGDERPSVHSYPPWHTTFFWWYGWFSFKTVAVIMYALSCMGLLLAFFLFRRWVPDGCKVNRWAYWITLLIFMLQSYRVEVTAGNYAGLLLLGSLILFFGMERFNSLALGIVWAIMMIKPQVAVLFFWPLLFSRRYLAIALAVIICSLATLWPAYVYGESPLELILQIPQAGAAYEFFDNARLSSYLYRFVGSLGVNIWSVVCFVMCGIWSYTVRKNESLLVRFLPVCYFIPIWTYSNAPDWVVLWPLYVLMARELSIRFNWSAFLLVLSLPVLYYGFHALAFLGVLDASQHALPYVLYSCTYLVFALAFALGVCKREWYGEN